MCLVLLGLPVRALASALPQEHPTTAIASEAELVIDGQRVRVIQHVGGALCVVCGEEIHAHDSMYQVGGQRVPVHAPGSACNAAFRADPQKFLAALQPRGAFLGGAPSQVSFGWFLFGCYVLLGLVFAGLCGQAALHRGHPQTPWFLAGFFFNVLAFLALLVRPRRAVDAPAGVPGGLGKIAATYSPVACACGAANHPSARQCSSCGAELRPAFASEVERAGT